MAAQNNLNTPALQNSAKIILGIDPGTVVMGYAILSVEGQQLCMVEMNTLKLDTHADHYTRLQLIYQTVAGLIRRFSPQCFAIEAPFFGKNVQSMLKLGRAQGVAIAAAMEQELPVCEYSPRRIKQSITGNGNADKEQVWRMLKTILSLHQHEQQGFDASDALAVAVCHHFQNRNPLVTPTKKSTGWAAFIAQNPQKIIKP